jgi:succinate dehydrogenase flavin-adding protein (antitoxin of CptAB toxin-antitoxin module)
MQHERSAMRVSSHAGLSLGYPLHLDTRCRRLLFRRWHRDTQEGDLILGRFAETHLADLDSAQLARFEALLDCTFARLYRRRFV